MYEINLAGESLSEIKALVRGVALKAPSAEHPSLLAEATVHAQDLPRDLRAGLNMFRLTEPSAVCLIRGFTVDDQKIGATPGHWQGQPDARATLEEELFLLLCGSLLGDPIGWATQQAGHIVHNVLPIAGREETQVGWSSKAALKWHTEDAFHPYRTDYVMLMCLRNPDRTTTTYAASEDLDLDPGHQDVLFEPRFLLRPDDSHLEDAPAGAYVHLGATANMVRRARALTGRLNADPRPVAVLEGDRETPYLRLDPFFMEAVPGDDEARRSLEVLIAAVDSSLRHAALTPGDVLVIDNYRCVHGRDSFIPRYDGTDRWLKRVNVARDLRKSRAGRLSPESRIIF
jgi:enduracididine beta-hydroxylase